MKTIILTVGLLFSALSSALSYGPDEWSHFQLKSEQGLHLSIDFQLSRKIESDCAYSCPTIMVARNIWFNLRGNSLRPSDKVSVVFMNYYNSRNNQGAVRTPLSIPLWWDASSDKFTGRLKEPGHPQADHQVVVWTSGFGIETTQYRQEVAIVVNGEWQVDPMNGTHNFKFQMFQY